MESHAHVSPPLNRSLAAANSAQGKGKLNLLDSDTFPPHLRAGLQLLLQAYEYALDLERDPWQFAVHWAELRSAGTTTADCRWLVWRGWANLACELKPRLDGTRHFQHDARLIFSRRTCLTLTDLGVLAAKQAFNRFDGKAVETLSAAAQISPRVVPQWNRDCHELRVLGRLVKQYKLPSPNQETILMALEEERWPPRIDDPLPPAKKIDAKQRLHDTIKNLNRHQKERLIRFMGDGTGQGVRWEFIADHPMSVIEDGRHRRHPK